MHVRNGMRIEIKTPGISNVSLTPAVYGNDSTNDDNFDQPNDGLGLPISTLIQNFLAYLDWAALRPMTEFEYEKACRGTVAPVLNEFAWGTTDALSVGGNIINKYSPNEKLTIAVLGPINNSGFLWRVGIAATSASDRIYAGATYYGILDMTSNAFERCIGGWGYNYANFTTANGDGLLDVNGFANVPTWPASTEGFYSKRGGSVSRNEGMLVSDRAYANLNDNNVNAFVYGGRGVRSF
jgi:hypothetical protein